jgi:hypothetical protein
MWSSLQVGGFLRVLRFPLLSKTDSHDITEILLKVALNTITQTLNHSTLILWLIVQDEKTGNLKIKRLETSR